MGHPNPLMSSLEEFLPGFVSDMPEELKEQGSSELLQLALIMGYGLAIKNVNSLFDCGAFPDELTKELIRNAFNEIDSSMKTAIAMQKAAGHNDSIED